MKLFNYSSILIYLCSFLIVIKVCDGANILFFFVMGNYSHRIGVWTLVEALANRGHNITFFTNYKAKETSNNPRIREFFPKVLDGFGFAADINSIKGRAENKNAWTKGGDIGIELCDLLLQDPSVLSFINQNDFDLIVIDTFYCDCGLGLVYKYKVPHILFSSASPYSWQYDENGILPETNWIADVTAANYPEDIESSLYWRTLNTLHTLSWHFYKEWYYNPRIEEIIRKRLNLPNFPPLRQIQRNVGLIFMNTHFSDEYPRSLPPLFVPVGGIHCKEAQKLPPELEAFINSSGDQGFIYISLGSSAKISHLPAHLQIALFNAMGNSSTSFIIKWNGEKIPDLPGNIYTGPWMPQQDILGHSKIRGFITHGGLLSIQEGICKGVPLIVLPVFGDQDRNAHRVQAKGYGISLEILDLDQEKFQAAIHTILYNDSYKLNMKKLSKIFHDRPQKPLELAVWSTEYILRHKTTPFLKSKGIYQTWYERRSVDVWVLLFFMFQILVVGVAILFYYLVKLILYNFKWKKSSNQKSSFAKVGSGGGKLSKKVK